MLEKEIIINGFKIKYTEKQNADKVVFVFLHGWGSNYKSFVSIYQKLDACIAFDFPGFGESSEPQKPLMLSDYARLTADLIGKKLRGKQIIFVAHSFGGRVLLKLLNQNKIENVKQVICIGVPFGRNYTLKNKIVHLITKIAKMVFLILPISTTRKLRKIWYKLIGSDDYVALENETIKQIFRNVINEDISKMARVLKNYKTDFIWGSDDREAPLSKAIIVAEKVGAGLHIIQNGGHFPFIGKTADKFRAIFQQITSR